MCSRNTPSPQGYEMLFQGMKHVFSSKTVVFHTFMLQPLSNLFSAGSFSEEEVRTPRTCRRSPHSPLIPILKAFLAPLPFIFETPTLRRFRSFLRRLQPALVMTIPHTCCPIRRRRCPHLLQFSPSRLFSEGVAYAVRPH